MQHDGAEDMADVVWRAGDLSILVCYFCRLVQKEPMELGETLARVGKGERVMLTSGEGGDKFAHELPCRESGGGRMRARSGIVGVELVCLASSKACGHV